MSPLIRSLLIAALLTCLPAWNAHANSFGFSSSTYTPVNGQLKVTVVYDYSDFAMSGGAVDLLFDAGALEFVSYTIAPLADDVAFAYAGSLQEPGRMILIGHGSSKINFFGINSAGEIGTLVFNIISATVSDPGCDGFQLCLRRGDNGSGLGDLGGTDVTEELLAGAQANPVVVPLPASLWSFASAVFGIIGLRKSS